MRVDRSIASILSFIINIPSSSKSIGLGSELTRVKADNKVKLEQIFRPSYLSMDKNFSNQKIFKVFVIYNYIDGKGRAFQVMSPDLKCFKDSKEFLVMSVVVKLGRIESTGIEGY